MLITQNGRWRPFAHDNQGAGHAADGKATPPQGAHTQGRASVARHAYPATDNLSEKLAHEIRTRATPGRGNVWRMLLWTPNTAEKFIDYSEAVRFGNDIPEKLRELIILRVGNLCGAAYEVHHHKRLGRQAGMSESSIEASAIGPTAPDIDDAERFALRMADELVRDKQLSESTFEEAVKQYGVRTVADIILIVGFYTMACMFLNSFGIEIEPEPVRA